MFIITTFLALLGLGLVFYYTYLFLRFLYINYFVQVDYKKKYAKAGNWVVITGSTDGIGFAYAKDLAKRGMNIYLIARNPEKLDRCKTELLDIADKKGKKDVEVKTCQFDFTNPSEEDWTNLQHHLLEEDKIECAVLINNVGVSYPFPTPYEQMEMQKDTDLVKINILSLLRMTKIVLPSMIAKKCGGIIFMSSFSALHPTGMLSSYAGSKAFAKSFGEGLSFELRKHNIDVMVVAPNLVVSNMTAGVGKKPKKSFLMVDTDEMAHSTLNKLGHTLFTSGHPHHEMVEGILKHFLCNCVVGTMIVKQNFVINKIALKKLAKASDKDSKKTA